MKSLEILEKFGFFRGGDDSLRKAVVQNMTHVTLAPGTYTLHEGDPCNAISFVGQGRIRVFKTGETGREITLYNVQEGESCFLSVMALLSSRPYPASALVESPVEAVILPASVFRELMERNIHVRTFVFDMMGERFANLTSLLEEIAFGKMDRRLADFLLRRFSTEGADSPALSVTHEQIAVELGTAREVVSRLLKEFERVGAIRLMRGRIILQDRRELESFTPTPSR